ncbi:MAG: formylglycine-generating enzyme family protein [Pseudomonadota bacterium]|nr:formylglycine-generating enzyme family protein [Pseudomonadota bacterium]
MNKPQLTGLLLGTLAAAGGLAWLSAESALHMDIGGTGVRACALPPGDAQHPGMVWVAGDAFTMGTANAYPEEGPPHAAEVAGFWMDQSEVTNAQFAEFVAATGYVTLAERGIDDGAGGTVAGSAVFAPRIVDGQLDPYASWWQFRAGANWREPQGPGSGIAGLEQHPVVHVAWEDALAYADWKGHSLPTEEQFEYAAQTSVERFDDTYASNTWQGSFPVQNEVLDGYGGTAPVGCYTPNALGLYDLIGNVWEWTASPYYASHDFRAADEFPDGYDPAQPGEPVAVVKGGSFLCAANYCARYRPQARQGQSRGLGTEHTGFRTVLNAP